jgi:hypothetical protein
VQCVEVHEQGLGVVSVSKARRYLVRLGLNTKGRDNKTLERAWVMWAHACRTGASTGGTSSPGLSVCLCARCPFSGRRSHCR